MAYVDPCIRTEEDSVHEEAVEIGWDSTNKDFETVFLEASDWGELKKKISQNRENADILVFLGENEELNRKAVSDSRLDVILSPDRKDREAGVGKVIAEKAAENDVAIGLDFSRILQASKKEKISIISSWRQVFERCEKHGTDYIITTGATEKFQLRAPRDLKAFVNSLNGKGAKAVNHTEKILEKNRHKKDGNFVRPGVEKK